MRSQITSHMLLVLTFTCCNVAVLVADPVLLDPPPRPSGGSGAPFSGYETPREVELDGFDAVQVPPLLQSDPLDVVSARGFNLDVGFNGVVATANSALPPDTHVAVGPGLGADGRVIMVTNHQVQVWDKLGMTMAGPLGLDAMFGANVFDPKVLYDQHSGRFFIVCLEGRSTSVPDFSNIHIAVSSTGSPKDLTGSWNFMAGSSRTDFDGTQTWSDYPSIGADNDSLFVTTNQFNFGPASVTFRGAKIRVFDKAALLAGIYSFVDIDIPNGSDNEGFTIQPAHVYQGTTDNGGFYLISRLGAAAYRIYNVTGDPAAPVLAASANSWATGAFIAAGAQQNGTPVLLDTLSDRVQNAVYRNGSIWLCLASDPDGDGQAEVVWQQISTNGGPAAATVAQGGFINGTGTNPWTYMPSIGVNAAGDATVCYTQSSVTEFAGVWYASRLATDPENTFRAPNTALPGPGFYHSRGAGVAPCAADNQCPNNNCNFGTGFCNDNDRWGDYSASVVDPTTDCFWVANEFAQTSVPTFSAWGTFIGSFCVGDPSPVCDSGGPYDAECLGKTQLDGRGSYDPDGTINTYLWWTDCPGTSGFLDDSNPTPVFVAGSDGVCAENCRVWLRVTDDDGISSTCSTDMTIIDTQPPEITLPDNQRLACEGLVPSADVDVMTVTDCVQVQRSWVGDQPNGGGGCPGDPLVIARTYRAWDVCGNPGAEKERTFTVVDDEGPTFTFFPPDVELQCSGELPKPDLDQLTADDNCPGTVVFTWVGDTKGNGSGCPTDPLFIWRTYRATDECGNFTERLQQFKIADDLPPEFTEVPDDEGLQCIDELPEPDIDLVEATDNCIGPVVITWEGDEDNGGEGCIGDPRIITRTYRATDVCGNYDEIQQVFTIVDTEAPTIECTITNAVQPIEVDSECTAFVEFSVTVTNNCCVDPGDVSIRARVVTGNAALGPIELDTAPPVAATVTITGRVMVSDLTCCPATVEIIAEATDCCGQETPECSESVDVIDNYPPAGACGLTHDHPGWNWVDNRIELTGNEPTYFSALSGLPKGTVPFDALDSGWLPGRPDPDSPDSGDHVMRGFVVAWAVNEYGEEISWNHLYGSAVIVNYKDLSAWEYAAPAFQVHNADRGQVTGTPGVLGLNGVEYDSCFDQLLLDFYTVGATIGSSPSRSFTVGTDLTMLPMTIDLMQDNVGPVTTKARFDVWNTNGKKFSGTERCITCWDQTLLGNFGDPNNFLMRNLQTSKGRARIDGLESSVCPGSTGAALLGLTMKQLSFSSGLNGKSAQTGTNLVGMGTQAGEIKADVLGAPPLGAEHRPVRQAVWKPVSELATSSVAAEFEVASVSEKGSLLIFPNVEVRWDWCGKLTQNTFLSLSNNFPGDVLVQMYFVNGDLPEPAKLPRCVGP